MKKLRLHIIIPFSLFLLTFIIGTFLDLKINARIFSDKDKMGLILSIIGTIPGYGVLALLGGGYLSIVLAKKYKTLFNVLFIGASIGALGASIYFSGKEFFGPNGFTGLTKEWLGYFISLPIMGGLYFLGFKMGKKSDNPQLWIILTIIAVAIFLALVPGVTMLKAIFHRPRYRTIQAVDGIDFLPWYTRCSNYKELMSTYNVISEEFKSFPSGHAGAASCFMLGVIFLPMINKKYENSYLFLYYIGLSWTILIAFSRMLVGAHFLSDVSMGAMLTIIFMFIANEVIILLKKKKILVSEEE